MRRAGTDHDFSDMVRLQDGNQDLNVFFNRIFPHDKASPRKWFFPYSAPRLRRKYARDFSLSFSRTPAASGESTVLRSAPSDCP